MVEVVVYLTEDYSKNASVWVSKELSDEDITKIVNDNFDIWYYYDIL